MLTGITAKTPLLVKNDVRQTQVPKTPEPSASTNTFDRFLQVINTTQPRAPIIHGANSAQNMAELIRFQVAVNDYHLRLEMLTKAAESALATVKKLQNPS